MCIRDRSTATQTQARGHGQDHWHRWQRQPQIATTVLGCVASGRRPDVAERILACMPSRGVE
eukprot:14503813-Alexandrium_andersonii.AAC.1